MTVGRDHLSFLSKFMRFFGPIVKPFKALPEAITISHQGFILLVDSIAIPIVPKIFMILSSS